MSATARRANKDEAAGLTPRALGKLGERMAARFLVSRGFLVIERNFSSPIGEIDIVAEDDKCLVFVEVKTRSQNEFGPPLSSITRRKEMHILRNCLFYLNRRKLHDRL